MYGPPRAQEIKKWIKTAHFCLIFRQKFKFTSAHLVVSTVQSTIAAFLNQSRCRNGATPRQCAVVGFETKYYIHALNLLHSPVPIDVTDDVILMGSLLTNNPTTFHLDPIINSGIIVLTSWKRLINTLAEKYWDVTPLMTSSRHHSCCWSILVDNQPHQVWWTSDASFLSYSIHKLEIYYILADVTSLMTSLWHHLVF